MAQKIIMPKQGLQMTEGTIIKWLVEEGGQVKEGDQLFEMETDKLTITIDSTATGTLLKIVHGEGDVVPIAETIAIVGEAGEDFSDLLPAGESKEEAKDEAPTAAPAREDVYKRQVIRIFIAAGEGSPKFLRRAVFLHRIAEAFFIKDR